MKSFLALFAVFFTTLAFGADEGFQAGLYANARETICGIRLVRSAEKLYASYDRNPGTNIDCDVAGAVHELTCATAQDCSFVKAVKRWDPKEQDYVWVEGTFHFVSLNAKQFIYTVNFANEKEPTTKVLFTRWGSGCE